MLRYRREFVRNYDPMNRLSVVKDARGNFTYCTYMQATGWSTGMTFSKPDTCNIAYAYNILGQTTQITDAAGTHTITYDRYGTQTGEDYPVEATLYHLTERTDSFGRNIGHTLTRGDETNPLLTATTGYASDGRIGTTCLLDRGVMREYSYSYLEGSNLLSDLAMPCGMHLIQQYEEKRNLLTEMLYTRGNLQVTLRRYTYDKLSRPIDRTTEYPQKKQQHTAAFGYNNRSELTSATLDETDYGYNYDNIGNRITAQEAAEQITYDANNLNQYTQIDTDGTPFVPEYDADGNQTLIKTSTGIWRVKYNGQNRAIRFESEDGTIVITCDYDYMGRRAEKKVEVNGEVTSHIHYVYRGYLQIAAHDLLQEGYPSLWQIIWDPTQTIATRPLAIRMNGTFYIYGWDLTKNICETYAGSTGYLASRYTYTPYGQVTATGDITQTIQWSSEVYDSELGLVYYNYRYYNPLDGRWTRRDPVENVYGLYTFISGNPMLLIDVLGEKSSKNTCCCGKKKMRATSLYCDNGKIRQRKQRNIVIYFGHCNGPLYNAAKNNKNAEKIGAVTCFADDVLEETVDESGRLLNQRKDGDTFLLKGDSMDAAKSEYEAALSEAKSLCNNSSGEILKVVIQIKPTDGAGKKYLMKTMAKYPQVKEYTSIKCPSDCTSRGGTIS